MAGSAAEPRFRALLLGVFASLALVLAAIGVYGVISQAVSRRTPEIGIRVALGASPSHMLGLILRQGLILTAIGLGIGLAASLALTRLLSSLLFGIGAADPATYLLVSLLLLMAARFVHGSATAIMGPVMSAAISDVAPAAKRATWLSTYSTVQGAGQAIAPVIAEQPSLEAGPIMVQVEYCVDPPQLNAFWRAMAELGQKRRRDGAMHWWIFQDTADPSRFVETWIEATWAEHLRNHERVSVAHQVTERRIQSLTRSGSTIVTRHFVAPEPARSTNAVLRALQESTPS